jgi:hypothetical protein
VLLLQAQLHIARGQPAAALKTLDALDSRADERPPLLLRAQAGWTCTAVKGAAHAADLRSSTEALQTWVAERPQDAAAWDCCRPAAARWG